MTSEQFKQQAQPHINALLRLINQMPHQGDKEENSQQCLLTNRLYRLQEAFNGITEDDLVGVELQHEPSVDELYQVLERVAEMVRVAHKQFNWGASCLTGEAIALLNEVPVEVGQALNRRAI